MFCRAVGGEWADLLDGKALDHPLKTEFGEHFVNFQGVRTRYFDNYFQAAAEAGVRQIVLLAAGLDSRAYRLPWPDGTVVFELDQPQVLEFKREVLARTATRRPPSAARSPSTCVMTGHRHCATTDSIRPGRRPGSLKDYSSTCPLPPSSCCSRASTRWQRPAATLRSRSRCRWPPDAFEAKRDEELAGGNDRTFFTLVYNEQHAPAHEFFGSRGWWAVHTPLPD